MKVNLKYTRRGIDGLDAIVCWCEIKLEKSFSLKMVHTILHFSRKNDLILARTNHRSVLEYDDL